MLLTHAVTGGAGLTEVEVLDDALGVAQTDIESWGGHVL